MYFITLFSEFIVNCFDSLACFIINISCFKWLALKVLMFIKHFCNVVEFISQLACKNIISFVSNINFYKSVLASYVS